MSVHVVHICGKFSESPMKAPCLTWSCALSRAHRARPVRSGAALREQAEGAVLARTWPKPPQLNGAAVVRKSSSCRQTGSSCSSFVARTSSLSSSTGAAAAAARKAKLADVAALVSSRCPCASAWIFNVVRCLLRRKDRERRSWAMRSRAQRGVRGGPPGSQVRTAQQPRRMQVASGGRGRSGAGRTARETAAETRGGRAAHRGARRGG